MYSLVVVVVVVTRRCLPSYDIHDDCHFDKEECFVSLLMVMMVSSDDGDVEGDAATTFVLVADRSLGRKRLCRSLEHRWRQ